MPHIFPPINLFPTFFYKRMQRFLGLVSGGSRAAKMASSKTFFNPLCREEQKRSDMSGYDMVTVIDLYQYIKTFNQVPPS